MLLNYFLLVDPKNFSHQSEYYNFLFLQLGNNIVCNFFFVLCLQMKKKKSIYSLIFWLIFILGHCSFKIGFYLFKQFCVIFSWWSYTRKQGFVSVNENVTPWSATLVITITDFLDQFRSRLISKLIEDVSRVLLPLLQRPFYYCRMCAILSCFTSYFFFNFKRFRDMVFFSKTFLSAGFIYSSSSLYCQKIPDVFE